MERYRRTYDSQNKDKQADFKTKLIRQTVICVIIFASVFVISLLKTDTAKNISAKIKSSITYTVDYKATVHDIFDKINNLTKGNTENEPKETDKIN